VDNRRKFLFWSQSASKKLLVFCCATLLGFFAVLFTVPMAMWVHELSHFLISFLLSILALNSQIPQLTNFEWLWNILPVPHKTIGFDIQAGGFSLMRIAGPIGEFLFYLLLICKATKNNKLRLFGLIWPILMIYSNLANCPNSTDFLHPDFIFECPPAGVNDFGIWTFALFWTAVFYQPLKKPIISKLDYFFSKLPTPKTSSK